MADSTPSAHQREDLVQGEWRQGRGALPSSLIFRSVLGWNGMELASKGWMEPTDPLAQGSCGSPRVKPRVLVPQISFEPCPPRLTSNAWFGRVLNCEVMS